MSVVLNQEQKGEFFVLSAEKGDFAVRVEDLKNMGFRNPEGTTVEIGGEDHLSLKSMKEVEFIFNEKTVMLNISASPGLLAKNRLDFTQERQAKVYYPRDNSAFLNYGATYSGNSSSQDAAYGLTNQAGARIGDFLFLSDSNYSKTRFGEKFARLMSSVTYDDRDEMQRWIAGDFFAASGIFNGTVNLGGLSFSKRYSIAPYFIKSPLINFSGFVSLPSALDVYLNGMKVRTETVSPGEFELRNLAAYGGSGVVDIVIKDAFGKEQKISHPYYSSDALLSPGLHEYSYNAGWRRENFGMESGDYGDPAAVVFHRYGLAGSATIAVRAEATRGLYTLGPEMSFLLSRFGVVTASGFASKRDGRKGSAAGVHYAYQGRTFNTRLFADRYSDSFATISRVTFTTAGSRHEEGVSIGFGTKNLGSFSLNYANAGDFQAQRTQTAGITYARNLFRNVLLFTSFNRIRQASVEDVFFIGITLTPWKDTSVSVRHEGTGEAFTDGVQVQKNLPVGEGLGYRASVDRIGTETATSYKLSPSVQYNARHGVYGADYFMLHDGAGTQTSYQLSASGAVVFVGNTVGLTRPVTDSFALVRAGDFAGVTVYQNNQEVGKTDSEGKLFVPNLGSYYDNRLSINDREVPLNYVLSEAGIHVSPPYRSGSCVSFRVKKEQPVTGTIAVKINHHERPVEFREITMVVNGKEIVFPAGSNGEFYIESQAETGPARSGGCSYQEKSGRIRPGVYAASFEYHGKTCRFQITIPETDDMFIDLGKIICELGIVQAESGEKTPEPAVVLELPADPAAFSMPRMKKGLTALAVYLLKNPGKSVEIAALGKGDGASRVAMKVAHEAGSYLVRSGVKTGRIRKIQRTINKDALCGQPAGCGNGRVVVRVVP